VDLASVVYAKASELSKFDKSRELRILQLAFSTGVRLRELRSIALVLANVAGIPPPHREARRNSGVVLAWFRRHWDVVLPLLPTLQLRDSDGNPINGMREVHDRGRLLFDTD
jgi:hypothetical protein